MKTGAVLWWRDFIVHRRGAGGPNLLVIEIKKVSNPEGTGCDKKSIAAFREQLGYRFGAVVVFETRRNRGLGVANVEWAD